MRRKLIYVTGTRADYGLMSRALSIWNDSECLSLSVCVTGMHLLQEYGFTVDEIRQSEMRICGEIRADLANATGGVMAKAIATELTGMVDVFARESPDLVVLLGDRGEMVAGALAAIHLNIPIVHIHGGERSGTVDEPVRHAISKLSHYHFTATDGARERLIRMGEEQAHIFTVGAPGLDGLTDDAVCSKKELYHEFGFSEGIATGLMVFHPVVQDASAAGEQMDTVLAAVTKCKMQVVCLLPNADAGSNFIRCSIERFQRENDATFQVLTHLPRKKFISWMKCVDVMIGNSSSGIIEAATFGTPVVNIGCRQQGRERSCNVLDVDVEEQSISEAIKVALQHGEKDVRNVYGDGESGSRMLKLLETLPLDKALMNKLNAY
ncbi:MAG: UDP-N-acetylglucosamine 2-epimerase [Ghiorsea sp.]|nr:UDP-N-acetylglucosamine 2-epimerase [Ghiorsea sp.]